MKNTYLLLISFFLCSIMHGQIVDLKKFSKGKFYWSDHIKDENNNIKGYLVLYESDKMAKETYQLEYVVLDENLTKVTNGFINEMKFESWLMKSEKISVSVSVYKDNLLLRLADSYEGEEFFKRYRLLSIKNNKISEPFIYNKGKMILDPVIDRKLSNISDNHSEDMFFFDEVGLVANSTMLDKSENLTKSYLAHFDENMKEVWRFEYGDISDKKIKDLHYLKSDKDVIVLFNHAFKNKTMIDNVNEVSALFLDSKSGALRKEFAFPDLDKFSYRVVDCNITADKIYLAGNYSKSDKTGFIDDDDNTGLFNFVFNKANGELIKSTYFNWESLLPKLDINKKGYVKKEGNLFIHEMLFTSTGKLIVAAEAFTQSPITTNNIYFLEFNDKFEIEQLFEVQKFRNKFPKTIGHSSQIKKYGLFDFIDYQSLGDDEYLFFVNDSEKNSVNGDKRTLFGIISYSDGKFKRQTLELKESDNTKSIYNAKKGYLMIFESSGKSKELRLEKINY